MEPGKIEPSAPPVEYQGTGNNAVHPVVVPIQTTTVMIVGTKDAPSFESYQEACHVCKLTVATRVEYVMGTRSWVMIILGIFLFCPLLCCFCCECSKDAKHYCPKCNLLLSVKKR